MSTSSHPLRVLHLDTSIARESSTSRALSAAIVATLSGAQVQYRDLATDPIEHLSPDTFIGFNDESERTLAQFLWADVVVIGSPMINFSIPSNLKAWIDRIAVAGKTFRYTEKGPEGLAGGKRVFVASSRDGAYAPGHPLDFQETYLRAIFAFMGVEDIQFIRAEGLAMSPEGREQAIALAHAQVAALDHKDCEKLVA